MFDFFKSKITKYFGIQFRSSEWSKTRKEFIKENNCCSACGTKNKLEVHHILPFHLYPEFELDKTNLITLCKRHHLTFGHLMNFKSYNPTVVDDTKKYKFKVENRP